VDDTGEDPRVAFMSQIITKFKKLIAGGYIVLINAVNKEFLPLLHEVVSDTTHAWVSPVSSKLTSVFATIQKLGFSVSFLIQFFGDVFSFLDATLFKIICNDSQLCTPKKGIQLKYALNEIEDWSCSEHPELSHNIEKLCHIREAANLLVSPKSNLTDKVFREQLFPNLSMLQLKHLLTIFNSDSPGDRIPPTVLSTLSSSILYGSNTTTASRNNINNENINVHVVLGNFEENESFHFVDTEISDVESVLEKDDSYQFLQYIYSISEKSLPLLDSEVVVPPASPLVNINRAYSSNNLAASNASGLGASGELTPYSDSPRINNNNYNSVISSPSNGGGVLHKSKSNEQFQEDDGANSDWSENAADLAKKLAHSAKSDLGNLSKNLSSITTNITSKNWHKNLFGDVVNK
jgi:hypothetical protein